MVDEEPAAGVIGADAQTLAIVVGEVVGEGAGDRRTRLGEVVADLADRESIATARVENELMVVKPFAQDAVQRAQLAAGRLFSVGEARDELSDKVPQLTERRHLAFNLRDGDAARGEGVPGEPRVKGLGVVGMQLRGIVPQLEGVGERDEELRLTARLPLALVEFGHDVTITQPLTSYIWRCTIHP